MKDPRLENLARVLTRYSLRLKPGDILAINGEAVAAPLIRECYRAALRCGAFVICDVALDGLPEIFYAEANDKQLKWLSPFAKFKVRRIDASIGIWAGENTKALTNVDPKRLAAAAAARKPLNKIFMDRSASGDAALGRHPMAVQRQCAGCRDVAGGIRGVRLRRGPSR